MREARWLKIAPRKMNRHRCRILAATPRRRPPAARKPHQDAPVGTDVEQAQGNSPASPSAGARIGPRPRTARVRLPPTRGRGLRAGYSATPSPDPRNTPPTHLLPPHRPRTPTTLRQRRRAPRARLPPLPLGGRVRRVSVLALCKVTEGIDTGTPPHNFDLNCSRITCPQFNILQNMLK